MQPKFIKHCSWHWGHTTEQDNKVILSKQGGRKHSLYFCSRFNENKDIAEKNERDVISSARLGHPSEAESEERTLTSTKLQEDCFSQREAERKPLGQGRTWRVPTVSLSWEWIDEQKPGHAGTCWPLRSCSSPLQVSEGLWKRLLWKTVPDFSVQANFQGHRVETCRSF